MTRTTARAWAIAALTAVLLPAQAAAQQPDAGAKGVKPTPISAAPLRRPSIVPPKPMVASKAAPAGSKPTLGSKGAPAGGSSATPAAPSDATPARVPVSARQAAEQTIAALVAAMKNMPKRPPPPDPRIAAARRAAAARAAAFDAPPPIDHPVTWAKPEELGVNKRVELVWPAGGSGPVALRWNEPAQ